MAENFALTARGQTARSENWLVPQQFWQVTLEKQDWHHGMFISVERGTDLQMGTDWEIRCEALGVAFNRSDIEAMKSGKGVAPSSHDTGPPATAKPKRGRPRGSGAYLFPDSIVVEKMHEWMAMHPGKSAAAAAQTFVDEAEGGGTEQTKIRRLARKYREAHPD